MIRPSPSRGDRDPTPHRGYRGPCNQVIAAKADAQDSGQHSSYTLREFGGQPKAVKATKSQQHAGVSNTAEVGFRGLGPGSRRTTRTDNMKFRQNIAVFLMCVFIRAVWPNDMSAAQRSCSIAGTIFDLELRPRTTVKAELHEHMLRSELAISMVAHDKFCGLKFILNVARMVFDIIASIIKFDTAKVDIKTYLDSHYGGKQCTLGKVQGSGDKQCAFGRVQGFISKLMLKEVENKEATYHARQTKMLEHGARVSDVWLGAYAGTGLRPARDAAKGMARQGQWTWDWQQRYQRYQRPCTNPYGSRSNKAGNQGSVKELKQTSTLLHDVFRHTDMDGVFIPDHESIDLLFGSSVASYGSISRSAASNSAEHFELDDKTVQVHSKNLRAAKAQGVQHVEIDFKHGKTGGGLGGN